jgi:hypothetical protein
MPRKHRLLPAAALSTALVTTMLGGLGGAGAATSGTLASAEGDAIITLSTPDKVRGYTFGRRDRVWIDLGLTAKTGLGGLEVRSNRPSYDAPITTSWSSGDLSGSLPAGTQEDFRGLSRFARVIIRKLDGTVVARRQFDACLNSWGGARYRPDGEAKNPYPYGCPWNPYTVGSVQGIPGGWAVNLSEENGIRARLPRGRYDLTVRITDAYADALGLSRADRRHHSRLVVRRYDDFRRQESFRSSEAPSYRPAPEPKRASSGTTDGPRPDLRSLPAFELGLNRSGTQLRFGANVWNAGPSPLVVDGFLREDDQHVMDAYQYFFDADGNQVGYEQVGELHFHEGNHHHWHFEDFARYRLLDADMKPVRRSRKVSFCLANTDAVDFTVEGADWRPEGTDLSTACGYEGAQAIREVLSSGSGDTYYQFRSGQALRVEGLPNGIYYVSVEANPFGKILETDTTNNTSVRKIRLRGTPGNRRLKVFPVGVIDEGASSWR